MPKLPKISLGDIILIYWEDAYSTQGWFQDNPDMKPMKCITTGMFLKKNKHYIRVAQSSNRHGHQADLMTIPLSTVKKVRKIAELAS